MRAGLRIVRQNDLAARQRNAASAVALPDIFGADQRGIAAGARRRVANRNSDARNSRHAIGVRAHLAECVELLAAVTVPAALGFAVISTHVANVVLGVVFR